MSEADDRIYTTISLDEWLALKVERDALKAEKASLALTWHHVSELEKEQQDALREEIMKIWFVLKEAGSHPGRTDDKLGECVRRVVDERNALRREQSAWHEENRGLRERVEELERELAHATSMVRQPLQADMGAA